MINSFNNDFQTFVNLRLDSVGEELRHRPEYKRENEIIDKMTQELQKAMSPNMAINLQDIDDSYTAILNMFQDASYRLGFRDALRIIAGL